MEDEALVGKLTDSTRVQLERYILDQAADIIESQCPKMDAYEFDKAFDL